MTPLSKGPLGHRIPRGLVRMTCSQFPAPWKAWLKLTGALKLLFKGAAPSPVWLCSCKVWGSEQSFNAECDFNSIKTEETWEPLLAQLSMMCKHAGILSSQIFKCDAGFPQAVSSCSFDRFSPSSTQIIRAVTVSDARLCNPAWEACPRPYIVRPYSPLQKRPAAWITHLQMYIRPGIISECLL